MTKLCLAIALACILPLPVRAAWSAPAPEFTANELRSRLAEQNAKIQAYYVVYDAGPNNNGAIETGAYVRRQLAAASPASFSQWTGKQTALYSFTHDPLQQRLIVNGNAAITEHSADRAFIRSPTEGHLPGSAPREIMLLALGWWPTNALRPPHFVRETPAVLPDIAVSTDYRVRDAQELVADRWCHVLEFSQHDRLWLDAPHGCMIMARELVDPRSGRTVERIEASEVCEIASTVWSPKKLRNILFDASSGRVISDSRLVIREIGINNAVPRSLFTFEPKPGSIELKNGAFAQYSPGGLDFLDETAARLKRFPMYANVSLSSRSPLFAGTVIVGALIIVGVATRLHLRMYAPRFVSQMRSRPQ